jgi:multisubunit Na+/H+ antiporter MnhB subunit
LFSTACSRREWPPVTSTACAVISGHGGLFLSRGAIFLLANGEAFWHQFFLYLSKHKLSLFKIILVILIPSMIVIIHSV